MLLGRGTRCRAGRPGGRARYREADPQEQRELHVEIQREQVQVQETRIEDAEQEVAEVARLVRYRRYAHLQEYARRKSWACMGPNEMKPEEAHWHDEWCRLRGEFERGLPREPEQDQGQEETP